MSKPVTPPSSPMAIEKKGRSSRRALSMRGVLQESGPPPPWVTIENPVANTPAPAPVAIPGKWKKVHADGDLVGVFYVDESKQRKEEPPKDPAVDGARESFRGSIAMIVLYVNSVDVYISIEVRCETQPEERVAISGSDWQLGSWDPTQSWYLNTSPSLYPIWKDRIPMPSPGGQFKIFIKNTGGQFVWEPLPCNRTWPRHGLTPDTEVKLTYGESGITTVSMGSARESNKKPQATSVPGSAAGSRTSSAPVSPSKKPQSYGPRAA
eukprot:Skav217046  [mRNA]  locus=scaffold3938:21218:37802:- [translate_table: standard]